MALLLLVGCNFVAPPLPKECGANIMLRCPSVETNCRAVCSGLDWEASLPAGNWRISDGKNGWDCTITATTAL